VIIADILQIDPRITYLENQKVPFVAFGRSETQGQYSWIDLDFEDATRKAVERLRQQGHTRIALGSTANSVNYSRAVERAFRNALVAAGLPQGEDLTLNTGGSERGGYLLGDRWFAMVPRPTAIVLANELMAIGLYRRLAESVAVPGRDVAIITLIEQP